MKRPSMNIFPVWEHDYKKKTVDVIIYSHFEKTPNDWDEEEIEDDGEEDSYARSRSYQDTHLKNKISKLALSKINLQSLLDNLPEGIKPSDIKMSLNIDCGDMGVYGAEIVFSYKKHFPARLDEFKKDKEAYDKAYAEYEIEEQKYQKFLKEQEIKDLETKLQKLKK